MNLSHLIVLKTKFGVGSAFQYPVVTCHRKILENFVCCPELKIYLLCLGFMVTDLCFFCIMRPESVFIWKLSAIKILLECVLVSCYLEISIADIYTDG